MFHCHQQGDLQLWLWNIKEIPLVKLIVVANYSAQKTFARGAVDLVNGTLLTQCHRSKSLNLGAI
jgi:hypothetical protein